MNSDDDICTTFPRPTRWTQPGSRWTLTAASPSSRAASLARCRPRRTWARTTIRLFDEVRKHLRRTTAVQDLEGRIAAAGAAHVQDYPNRRDFEALVFVRSLDGARELITKTGAKEVPRRAAALRRKARSRDVPGLAHQRRPDLPRMLHPLELGGRRGCAQRGLFAYPQPRPRTGCPGPTRCAGPSQPVHVADLLYAVADVAIQFEGTSSRQRACSRPSCGHASRGSRRGSRSTGRRCARFPGRKACSRSCKRNTRRRPR